MLTLSEAKATKWYRQSGAGVPLCLGLPILSLAECMQAYCGLYFPKDVSIYKKTKSGYLFFHYFDYYLTLEQSRKIFDLIDNNFALFEKMKDEFYVHAQSSEKIGLKIIEKGLEDPGFANDYSEFIDESVKFWINSLYLDLLDPIENEIIDYIFDNRKKELSKADLNLLFSPDEPSILQKEQYDLVKISEADDADQIKLLTEHSEKYYFIKNDYESASYLDAGYFKLQLEKLKGDPKLKENLQRNVQMIEQNKQKKIDLVEKMGLDVATRKKLDFFNWSTIFRDDRKKYTQISCYILLELASKISKDRNIDLESLKFAMPKELPTIISGDADLLKELESRRETGVVIFADVPGKSEIVSGDVVNYYFESIEGSIKASEIKGSVASSGRVIGSVKVILNQNEFSKMEKGDVIVTSMTRPEFVPILQMASAVITDEGGITCHAAIVSRELGLPCITGTQIASKSLKDGDIVDVDAIHGIIKIIKKVSKRVGSADGGKKVGE